MATTVTTPPGTNSPTKFNNQRRYAQCANGVRWLAVLRASVPRIEFWYSTDAGATWTERDSHRITNVKQEAGCSIRIARRGDGEERMAVTYVNESTQRVRVNLAKFNAARTTFTWQGTANVSISGGGQSAFWKNPDCELVPKGSLWLVPIVWSRLYQGRCRLHYQRWLFEDTGSGHGQAGGDYELHVRTSSIHTHPTVGVQHNGGVIPSNPAIYIAWGMGNGSSEDGGTPTDPQPRQYLMRMGPQGNNWVRGTARVLREAGVGRDPGAGSVTSAVYTGQAWVRVAAPSGDQEATLQMHAMLPNDNVREVIDVPALNKGAVINVSTTYDPYNGDVYIVANGATNQNLSVIQYRWALKQWTSWSEVTAEGAVSDSVSLKPGTSEKKVEGVYAIVSGGNRAVRHEVFATVNTLPLRATWVTADGAANRNQALTPVWQHNDPDGDAQAAYTLERRVNGGDPQYWNGVGWQSGLVNISSAAASVTFAAGWATAGDVVEFRVRTSDAGGFGPWSRALIIVAAALVNPTITAPTNGANITSVPLLVTWSVAEQAAYRVELKRGDGVGLLWSTGWVGDAATRTVEIPEAFLDNGASYDIEVTTQNNAGLTSTTAKHDITVSLIPPPLPAFTWAAVPDEGAIDVIINNGTPAGGQAAAEVNDVIQVNAAGVETLVATGVAPGGTFRDRYVASGREVAYVVVAKTGDGATRRSDE